MTDDFDVEDALRASLAENARHAPSGDALAERIIAQADRPRRMPVPSHRRRWRTWTLPAVAAGSVVAVVGAVIATTQLRSPDANTAAITPPPSASAPSVPAPGTPSSGADGAATGSGPATSQATEPSAPTPSQVSSQARVAGPTGGPVPRAFRVADLTFVSPDDGWALGTAQCFTDATRRCPALLRTHDGGSSWDSIPNPPPSAGQIRFANQDVGYAYGVSALFMTVDGGADWLPQRGAAVSLEVANGTVLRVDPNGTVQSSEVGTDAWREVVLPGGAQQATDLRRAVHNVFVRARPAGATAAHLYVSVDDGASWADRANPCRMARPGSAPDIADIAAGADGSVTLVCAAFSGTGQDFLVTSDDGGQTFGPAFANPQIAPGEAVAGADGTTLFYAADALYRSSDGGSHWVRVCSDATTGRGTASFLGFQTTAAGRWVSGDGSTIWTTRDAGQRWQPHTFG